MTRAAIGGVCALALLHPRLSLGQREGHRFRTESVRTRASERQPAWHGVTADLLTPRVTSAQWSARSRTPSFGNAHDHRWEGVVIGGLVLGVGMAIVGSQTCEDSGSGGGGCFRTTVGFGLLGGTVGVVVGGIAGSLIPKRTARRR